MTIMKAADGPCGATALWLGAALLLGACAEEGATASQSDAARPGPSVDSGSSPFADQGVGGPTRPCADGELRACSDPACPDGRQVCQAEAWGACVGPAEICDGVDNDCNGEVDEALADQPCGLEQGICSGATKRCGGNAGWLACDAETYAAHAPAYAEAETDAHCDGVDNDCDGRTDEECPCAAGASQLCGSGEGECRQGLMTCVDGHWGPCKDEVTSTIEICNGRDDDCDGAIDEELDEDRPDCALSQGVCAGARAQCIGGGGWADCRAVDYGELWMAVEGDSACDGLDNDCDGQTDEECECVDDVTQSCGGSVGACEEGEQICQNGRFGECHGDVGPADEICNGLDDDCDGEVDEALEAPACGLTSGVCAGTVQVCAAGDGWQACNAAIYTENSASYVEVETEADCDGLDNDCDGLTDESCDCQNGDTQVCGTNVGVCTQGLQRCVAGRWDECDGVPETGEICDGLDNDCDNQIDEGLVGEACRLQDGICTGAVQRCVEGVWADCGVAEYGAAFDGPEELRCDRVDNDCDGRVDEDCDCIDGEEQACGTDEGECRAGNQSCTRGRWGVCRGAVDPKVELCNGLDDDCDGATDEALEAPPCALTAGVCNGATQSCAGETGWTPCIADDYLNNNPRFISGETDAQCDGLDNDCDGVSDEECECVEGDTQVCGTNAGVCTQGLQRCVGGHWEECDGVPATGERCNSLDDDCDGLVDEGLVPAPCPLERGVCTGAAQRCVDGVWAECGSIEYGATFDPNGEVRCDTLDNDCDGEVDEDCDCIDDEVQPCGSDIGACSTGRQTCVRGAWSACEGSIDPVDEICDGVDNDCDEEIDESLVGPLCPLEQGVCTGATESCLGENGYGGICGQAEYGDRFTAIETDAYCDGFDNDCDGQIDDECECLPADEQICGTDIGQCRTGRQMCVGGSFGDCVDAIGPVPETCDGLDNDCDGIADEELLAPPCTMQLGVCEGSTQICGFDNGWLACGESEYGLDWVPDEGPDACDGRDNDCDGLVDEGCPSPGIVISEIFFNPAGDVDGRNAFIELFGPEGARLNNMRLEAINGSNDDVYRTIDLDGLRIPFDGYLLIVELGTQPERGATETLRDIADLVVRGADLQNGPDSVRLVRNADEVIDAVGYLNSNDEGFPNPAYYYGEGAPVAGIGVGQTIARDALGTDTDDNDTDFTASDTPTPGGQHPLPRVHVSLRWNTDDTDYDLHLLRPNATWGDAAGGDVYYGNRAPDWGAAGDTNDDPRLDRDDLNGFGPEFIDYWQPAPGAYLVAAQYFSGDDDLESLATVAIYVDDSERMRITRQIMLDTPYWAVADIVVGPDGTIEITEHDAVAAEAIDNIVE